MVYDMMVRGDGQLAGLSCRIKKDVGPANKGSMLRGDGKSVSRVSDLFKLFNAEIESTLKKGKSKLA
jgi:hypothetical protein